MTCNLGFKLQTYFESFISYLWTFISFHDYYNIDLLILRIIQKLIHGIPYKVDSRYLPQLENSILN